MILSQIGSTTEKRGESDYPGLSQLAHSLRFVAAPANRDYFGPKAVNRLPQQIGQRELLVEALSRVAQFPDEFFETQSPIHSTRTGARARAGSRPASYIRPHDLWLRIPASRLFKVPEDERVNIAGGVLAKNTIDMPISWNNFPRITKRGICPGDGMEGLFRAFRKKTFVFGPVDEQYGHIHTIEVREIRVGSVGGEDVTGAGHHFQSFKRANVGDAEHFV